MLFVIRITKHTTGKNKHRICTWVLSAMALLVLSTACVVREKAKETPIPQLEKEFDTPVALIAATNKGTYTQTESITVTATVVVMDMDGNKISLDRGGDTPLARYQIIVLNERGEPVPQTSEGWRLVATGRHHMSYPVDQDSPDHESFRIDTWFDLSKPGKYTLILNRPAWIPKAINLTSNPVTFTRLP